MEDEFISKLQEIIDLYNDGHYAKREIDIWRWRFLKMLPKYDDNRLNSYMQMCFIATPSKQFVEKSPEEHIRIILDGYKTHYKD